MSAQDQVNSLRNDSRRIWAMKDPALKCEAIADLVETTNALDAHLAQSAEEHFDTDQHTVATTPVALHELEPGRPDQPSLVAASHVPKRQTGRAGGRGPLLHAIAHIEFNAVNLALDAVWRYPGMPLAYVRDWIRVAIDEARHFTALCDELESEDVRYGDFAAHDGLWDMARRTAHDLLARMALVPRVLEARGLDATPVIQRKLASSGDKRGADLLQMLLSEEIQHVSIGDYWFKWVCAGRSLDSEAAYRDMLITYEAPWPKSPMNYDARLEAGFSAEELSWLSDGAHRPLDGK